jgi:hypothetical protein
MTDSRAVCEYETGKLYMRQHRYKKAMRCFERYHIMVCQGKRGKEDPSQDHYLQYLSECWEKVNPWKPLLLEWKTRYSIEEQTDHAYSTPLPRYSHTGLFFL